MTVWRLSLAFLTIASLASAGRAQSQLRARLPSRADTLTVRHGASVIGRGIMTWTRDASRLLQVYVWQGAVDGASVTDSLWADGTSLRPQREVRVIADTATTVTFESDRVRVRTAVGGRTVDARTVSARAPVFSSASIEALAAGMPLASGSSAVFTTYYAPPSHLGLQQTRIRVEAQERVGGTLAWRVVADTPGGGTTFWVHAATRAVMQSDVREGPAVITFRR